jgi:hypothetical protein
MNLIPQSLGMIQAMYLRMCTQYLNNVLPTNLYTKLYWKLFFYSGSIND